MIPNAAINQKPVQAYDPELALYSRRELMGSPAVLVGTHDTNRMGRGARRTRHGPARRASLWVAHNFAALMALTGRA